jgi:hypothetical protein
VERDGWPLFPYPLLFPSNHQQQPPPPQPTKTINNHHKSQPQQQQQQILKKDPPSNKIGEGDVFTVNAAFSCPQRVIRIPMATIEESHNPHRVEVCAFALPRGRMRLYAFCG